MSRTKMTSPPAAIAVQPQPRVPVPGSAEFISSLLTGRGFCCPHFPKYHLGSSLDQAQYPSRVAFFHATGKDTRISFLDTNKLCSECLNLAVPDGFNYWSTFATVRDMRARDSPASQITSSLPSRWLDMATSSDSYPRLFQAGTEGFPQNTLGARYIASHCAAPPATVHIPQLPGAKEAWQWLQGQRKPFYIDQLHLNKGWSPFGEMMAYNDSAIAEKTGIAFGWASQTAEQKTKKSKKAPLHDNKAAVSGVAASDENGNGSGNVKRDKAFPSLKDTIVVPAATPDPSATPTGPAHQASKHVLKEKGKRSVLSESAKTASHTEAITPVVEKSGGTPAATLSTRSTKKSSSTAKPISDLKNKEIAPKTSSAPGRLQERAEPQALPRNPAETAEQIGVRNVADRKTFKAKVPSENSPNFPHTKNWSKPDPIPFDSPIMTLKLDDYKRRATVTDPKVSLSKLPLEQLIKKEIKDDNVSFSGPESLSRTPAIASFIGMTAQGESSTPKATSQFIASIVRATRNTVPRETKPRITETPQSQLPETEHPATERRAPESLILGKSTENPEPIPEASRTPATSNTRDIEYKPPNGVTPNTTTKIGPEGKTDPIVRSPAISKVDVEHAPSKDRPDTSPARSATEAPVNSEPPLPTGTHSARGSAGPSEEGGSKNSEWIFPDYEASDESSDNGDLSTEYARVDETNGAGEGHSDDDSEHRVNEDGWNTSDDDNEHPNTGDDDSMNGDGHDLSEDDQETSDGGEPEPSSHISTSDSESDGEGGIGDEPTAGSDEEPETDNDEEQGGESEKEDYNNYSNSGRESTSGED
ncbi:hypothetical protein DL770_008756 [Monosporascus sp. CRB-9-2]|nr:hypothetical protein DL770_008756 [Monosporascus sp. CRB-9-2]